MPKIVKKGSGITTRLVPTWVLADFEDWQRHCAPPQDYEDHARALVEWAKTTLRQAREEGRQWERDDDSPESYAQRIDQFDSMARHCIRTGNAAGAARFALIVGELAGEARLKFRWEKSALLGVARRHDTAKGGRKTGRAKKDRAAAWQEKIEDKAERMIRAGRTDNAIALSLASETGRTADTLRPFLRSLRKKLVAK